MLFLLGLIDSSDIFCHFLEEKMKAQKMLSSMERITQPGNGAHLIHSVGEPFQRKGSKIVLVVGGQGGYCDSCWDCSGLLLLTFLLEWNIHVH